jgi:hypothetical protein
MGVVLLLLGTGCACASILVSDRATRIALAIGAALNLGGLVLMILSNDPNLMRLLPPE